MNRAVGIGLARIPQLFLDKCCVKKTLEWLFIILFLTVPCQKRFHKAFDSIAKAIIPSDLSLPSFFSKKMDFYLSDFFILIIASICIYRNRRSLADFFFKGPAKYFCVLVAVVFLSLVSSISGGYFLQYYRLFQLALFLLFFCSIMDFFKQVHLEPVIRKIFWAIIIASLVECVIGIAQYFLQGYAGFKFLGEYTSDISTFPLEARYRWLFDQILGIKLDRHTLLRASGTFSHPNVLGGFLLFSTLTSYYLFMIEERKNIRKCLQFMILFQLFTLSLTFSRSAMIALFLSTFLWFGILAYQGRKSAEKKTIERVRILVITILVSVTICFCLLYSQFSSRGGIVSYNKVSKGADQERLVYQQIAFDIFKENPVLGVGYNNFQLHSHEHAPSDTSFNLFAKVHNIYLLILSEMGICGFCAFLLFIFSVLVSFFRCSKGLLVNTFFVLFLGYLFIGGCDFYLINLQFGKILFFSSAAFLFICSHLTSVNSGGRNSSLTSSLH